MGLFRLPSYHGSSGTNTHTSTMSTSSTASSPNNNNNNSNSNGPAPASSASHISSVSLQVNRAEEAEEGKAGRAGDAAATLVDDTVVQVHRSNSCENVETIKDAEKKTVVWSRSPDAVVDCGLIETEL